MLKTITLAIGLAVSAFSAQAAVVTYECEIRNRSSSGYLPDKLIITEDTVTGEIFVTPTMRKHPDSGLPVPATISTRNSKRTTYQWSLTGVKVRLAANRISFLYRATFRNGSLRVNLTGKPKAFSRTFTAKGDCTVATR